MGLKGDSAPAVVDLGLAHLPSRVARLAPGMLYGIACDQQSIRVPLLAGALLASLRAGRQCSLITPSEPRMFLRKAHLAAMALDAHVRTGQLVLLRLAMDCVKLMFQAGPEALIEELSRNLPGRDALIAFDRADSVFMLSDPRASEEASERYLKWACAQGHTLLATFAPSAAAPRDYLTLRRIAENFAGFAIVRAADGSATLEIRHWFGAEGASPRETFLLRSHGAGHLSVHAAGSLEEDQGLPPVDGVIVVRGVVGAVPGSWQEVDSIAEAVDAARRSDAATILLPFERPTDHPLLCRAIVTVRAMGRPRLRVVVRERTVRLRAPQVLALMRLGATSVLPPDVSDSGVRRLVDSLQGTRFARPFEMDTQQVDEDTSGVLLRRATSVTQFCDAVEALLAASDGFEVESCLVNLVFPGDGASAARIARRCGRDLLVLAQGRCVWLFLFGCPATQAASTLRRLFKVPPEEVCASWSLEHDADRILARLGVLREAPKQALAE